MARPSPTALPWLLAAVLVAVRAALHLWTGGWLHISTEAQVGLARAMAGPLRLDLELSGVHPGWNKAPLHPLLAWLGGHVVEPRLAATVLTWLYAAALVVLGARLARRLWGPQAATGAALALALLPWLVGDLREYALAAALALAAAERSLAGPPGARLPALGTGLLLGLLAAARWEGVAWALVILVAWTRRDPRAPLLGVGPAVLSFGLVHALCYPGSSLPERLGERLLLVGVMAAELAGRPLDQAELSTLGEAASGAPVLLAEPALPFASAWLQALPQALPGIAALLLHPATWPAWALAMLGARSGGRSFVALALGAALLLSFMPPKPGYLVLPACLLGLLAGRGLAGLRPRGRLLATALLLAGAVVAWGRALPSLAERQHLAGLHAVAAELRTTTSPDTHLLAEEDLCVLLMAERPCTFLGPEPAAMASWLATRGVALAVLPADRPDLLAGLAALRPGPPRPLPARHLAVALAP